MSHAHCSLSALFCPWLDSFFQVLFHYFFIFIGGTSWTLWAVTPLPSHLWEILYMPLLLPFLPFQNHHSWQSLQHLTQGGSTGNETPNQKFSLSYQTNNMESGEHPMLSWQWLFNHCWLLHAWLQWILNADLQRGEIVKMAKFDTDNRSSYACDQATPSA